MGKVTKDVDIDDNAFTVLSSQHDAQRTHHEILNTSRKTRASLCLGNQFHTRGELPIKQFDPHQVRAMKMVTVARATMGANERYEGNDNAGQDYYPSLVENLIS